MSIIFLVVLGFLGLLVFLLSQILILRSRVAKLEKFKDELQHTTKRVKETIVPERSEKAAVSWPSKTTIEKEKSKQIEVITQADYHPRRQKKSVEPEEIHVKPEFLDSSESSFGKSVGDIFQYIRDFFTTGNVVLKVGIVILFFGVAFLLKYAAQHSLISIELRLAGVALGGVALLVTGWFLRKERLFYGLILQGGGVGILYLTVFAASKLYGLVPHSFSFLLMFALVVLFCVLAVMQDSRALASFGACGGFLAPILMSTGSGSHVMLFSYYAVLNSGIFGIAWFRAWRELNLIGFVFTFGISVVWGYNYYQPHYFPTVEPFLVLFFLFYFAISILFAHRQPVQLKGFIDGPLVFGLPIVAFGMQAGLVENSEYGLAISALCLGGFYIVTATILWNRLVDGMRMLTEAFLAIGIVFGSLAIPFALDGSWTASAWALEGAAMVWVGVRQKRVMARLFGILLQLGAAVSFLNSPTYFTAEDILFINHISMSGFFIAIAALFSSYYLSRYSAVLQKWEGAFHYFLLGWGLIWWLVTGVRDLEAHAPAADVPAFILLFVGGTVVFLSLFAKKLDWQQLKFPLLGFLPFLIGFAFLWLNLGIRPHFFQKWGITAWLVSFCAQYLVLKIFEERWPKRLSPWYHLLSLWLLLGVITHDAAWAVDHLIGGAEVWPFTCWALVPAGFVVFFTHFGRKLGWPVQKYADHYLGLGVMVPLCYLAVWSVVGNFHLGNPYPLPHIILVNPLAVTQIFVFFVMYFSIQKNRDEPRKVILPPVLAPALLGFLIFLWLNGGTARLVHLYFDVGFRLSSLFHSVVFQSAISILWGAAALAVTIWATRRGSRYVWFAGALLLVSVVLKLFVVDLSGTGTIGRIVSFIAVGLLMLLIGYFSPLPPREEGEKS